MPLALLSQYVISSWAPVISTGTPVLHAAQEPQTNRTNGFAYMPDYEVAFS